MICTREAAVGTGADFLRTGVIDYSNEAKIAQISGVRSHQTLKAASPCRKVYHAPVTRVPLSGYMTLLQQ